MSATTTTTALPRPPAAPAGGTPSAARTRLLLEGPIISTLLRLGAPNVVVNVVLIAVTASIDAHFVGQLGAEPLAGLALVFPLVMLMQQMANASMGGAIASAFARAIGGGRHNDAASLIVHGVIVAVAMGSAFTAVVLTGGPAFYRLMGGGGATLAAAIEYSNVIFAGALAYWLLGALTSVVRGAGQAAVLGGVYLVAEAVHIALVPLLMFGAGPVPRLGITGAAVATVTAFTMSTLVLIWYIVSGRAGVTLSLRTIRLERRLFVEILRVGIPTSLTPILGNAALAALTGFVGTLGPVALAGFGAAVRLEYVQVPLTFGLGVGVLAMVGTNIGAGQLTRAVRITWIAVALVTSATSLIGVVAVLAPDTWISLFSADPAVRAAGAKYLRLVGLAYPFLGAGFTLSYAFQAAGRPLWPLLAVASRALLVVGGGWAVVHLTGTGLIGVAVISAGGLVVYGAALALPFRAGAWRPVAKES